MQLLTPCGEASLWSDEQGEVWPSCAVASTAKPMHFLRTLFWVILAVFLAIIARNNWFDVTINLWGSLQADVKLPVLVLVAALLGFLPTFLWQRAKRWRLERRLAIANPPAPTPSAEAPVVEREMGL